MKKKAYIYSHNGLGDALISLVVSENLRLDGYEATTFHNGIQMLGEWFTGHNFQHYPALEKIPEQVEEADLLIIFQNDTFDFVLSLIDYAKHHFPEKTRIIYPYPTEGIRKKPYYQDCTIDPSLPLIDNLVAFVRNQLGLVQAVKDNGMTPPASYFYKRYPKRVCLHIKSSREGKDWPVEKFLKLAALLKRKGYEPVIIAGSNADREDYLWIEKHGFLLPSFADLSSLAAYLFESGFLIGVDSGIGHLASSLKIPTITISRRRKVANFWRPSFAPNQIVVPPSFVPNISGWRLRDRKWKSFINPRRVYKQFQKLAKASC